MAEEDYSDMEESMMQEEGGMTASGSASGLASTRSTTPGSDTGGSKYTQVKYIPLLRYLF